MGKPRMIILIRHAQSEGNKNRDIHQFIPDHRVKLTPYGWTQAEEAGRALRAMLKPDDTLHFFTSPYRRTRETTEGILRTLTADDPTPTPFPRSSITVFEEPRLREQDFGNFQPCSAEMERMWQERADYGHFFYRIPDGESAADAYDRVSGFNESLWRTFGDDNFPSVCVLVTHGLMSRVFLMKWYHWSVEYFEDLRNVNHCEFIIMKRSDTNGRYILQNELRTWSELKRRAAKDDTATSSAPSSSRPTPLSTGQANSNSAVFSSLASSPTIPSRRWGGCVNGCNHDKIHYPRRPMRKNTSDYQVPSSQQLPTPATPLETLESEKEDQPAAAPNPDPTDTSLPVEPTLGNFSRKHSTKKQEPVPAFPDEDSNDMSSSDSVAEPSSSSSPRLHQHSSHPRNPAILRHLQPSKSPAEGFSDDSDYFPGMQHIGSHRKALRASSKQRQQSKDRKLARRQTEKEWKEESGMGKGGRTDRLGDGEGTCHEGGDKSKGNILPEARKGDMMVEQTEGERGDVGSEAVGLDQDDVEDMKERERKGFGEVY